MTQKFKNIVMTFLLSLVAGTLVAQDVFPTAPTDTLYTNLSQLGQIPMTQGVSPSGAYTVNIPLEVYAGIGDAQPQISLNYNSQQGNGLLGMGWSLGGISTISTGYWSLYYDGTTKSPATSTLADTTDALYLDGVRLVTSGSGYVTVTGNTKVSRMSTTGNYVNTFKAMYADGSQATYVRTGLKQYSISTYTDRNGNTMSYTYDTDSPVAHLTKITYNGPHATVEFEYDTSRTDPVITYFGGYKHTETKRLKAIRTKLDGVIQRYYQIGYTTARFASVLNTLTCRSVDSNAQALSFNYGDLGSSSVLNSFTLTGSPYYPFTAPSAIVTLRGKYGSLYGTDNDMIVTYPYKSSFVRKNPNHKHYFESGFDGTEIIHIYSGAYSGQSSFSDINPTLTTGAGFVQMMFADVSPLPGEELIKINSVVENNHDMLYFTVYAYSNTANVTQLYQRSFDMGVADIYHQSYRRSPWPREFMAADVDADGLSEIVAVTLNEPLGYTDKKSRCQVFNVESNTKLADFQCFEYDMFYTGVHTPLNHDRLYLLDLNGDGKADFLHINATGMHVYEFSGITSLTNTKNQTLFNKGDMVQADEDSKHPGEQLIWGDFNGDAFPDFIKQQLNQTGLYFGMGDATFEKSTITVPNLTRNMFAQDVDGDGRSDLVQSTYNTSTQKTTIYLYLMMPHNSFSLYNQAIPSTSGNGLVIPVDINRKGNYARILFLKDQYFTFYTTKLNDTYERLLTNVGNGFGVNFTPKYRMLSKGTQFYDPQELLTTNYPYTVYQGNLFVVDNVKQQFDNTIVENKSYRYTKAVLHRQGLGFMGFTTIAVTDSIRANRVTTSTYNPLNYGLPVSVVNRLARSTMEYSVTVDSNKKLHALLTKQIEKDSLKSITATTTYTYDSRDYPLTQTTSYGTNLSRSIVNTYQHTETSTNYLLGLPLTVTETTQRGGTSTWTVQNQMTYDTKGNVTQKQVLNGTSVRSTEDFTYNTKGQVLTRTLKEFTSTNTLTDSYTYDAYGRMTGHTDPTGLTTTYAYHAQTGLLANETDYRNNTTTYLRDAWGRTLRISYPDGSEQVTKYEWGPTGTVPGGVRYKVMERGSNSPTVTTFYDGLGRDVHTINVRYNGTLLKTDKQYDARGRLYRVSNPYTASAYRWTTYTYDTYDRLTKITAPGSRTTTYTYTNNNVKEVSEGVTITRKYNAMGDLTSVVDAAGTITYTLRPDGQPSKITAPGSVVTNFTYDAYGRRTQITDPSAGVRKYTYDTSGNVNKETDANNKAVTYTYDAYHRLTKKVNAEGVTTTYTYNTASLPLTETSSNGVKRQYTYDRLDRDSILKETGADNLWLQRKYTYKATGGLNTVVYSATSGAIGTATYTYANGYHTKTTWKNNGATSATVVYQRMAEDSLGNVTQIKTGTVTRTYKYNAYGFPTQRTAKNSSNTVILNQSYTFTANTGNLTKRTDNLKSKNESFTYDNLDRLRKYGNDSITYDVKGNILTKTDAGTYQYTNTAKPYAVTALAPASNSVPLRAQTVTYTSLQRPATITENGYTATFTYDDEGNRMKEVITHNSAAYLTKYYIGGIYEKETNTTNTIERLYLEGDYYSAPMVLTKTGTGSWTLRNILRDYQGSILKVTNSAGTTTNGEYSYDAWGRMRNPSTWAVYAVGSEPSLFLGRGYTGHEHLPMFGLINMNARLYDPVLGRFLAPDPYVQASDFSQSYNRYGYCLNNPLKYTDETGEYFGIDDLIAAAIGGTVNLVSNIVSGNTHNFWQGLSQFGVGAVGGWTGLYLSPVATGAIMGAGNSFVNSGFGTSGHWNWNSISIPQLFGEAFIGAATGYIGSKIDIGVVKAFGKGLDDVVGPTIERGIKGGLSGAVSGFAIGTGFALGQGESLENALKAGANSAALGFASGAVTGAVSGYKDAVSSGQDPWKPTTKNHSVYVGRDPVTGEVKYVGMTGRDPEIRWNEHLHSGTERVSLRYELYESGMTKINARIMEQTLINRYGMSKYGGQLYNKINSIGPKYWSQYRIPDTTFKK